MCDPYYVNRRENTLFVTIACAEPSPACFCTSVGGAPDSDDNSDILLVPVEGGYVARSVTDKGADLLKEASFPQAGDKEAEAEAVCEKANETMADATDFSGAPEALEKRFEDIEFWENMTAACINCGACTYLCPTCYCFNITDESDGEYGVRLRTWDSCMFYTYTQEASGHNPRPTKAHRMRNRVGHKFWYFMKPVRRVLLYRLRTLHPPLPQCRGHPPHCSKRTQQEWRVRRDLLIKSSAAGTGTHH